MHTCMLIAFNKPFGVLCQFTGEGPTLADFVEVPGVYPAGRLNKDSEGLLLTDDGQLQVRIASPKYKLARSTLCWSSAIPTGRRWRVCALASSSRTVALVCDSGTSGGTQCRKHDLTLHAPSKRIKCLHSAECGHRTVTEVRDL